MNNEKNLSAKETFDLAFQNHKNNNLQVAQNYYQKVLEIDPNHLAALNNLGNIFQKFGEYQKAEDCFEKVIEINPDHLDAHNSLVVIFISLREYQKAQSFCKKVIEINPNHENTNNNLGVIFVNLKEYQKAKDCFEKVIEINPNHANAHNNLGVLLLREGNIKKAKSCHEKAIELKPDYADAHNNLGIIFQELGEHQKAVSHCKKAIEINPNFAEGHNNLGSILKELGRFHEAAASYRQAIALKPDDLPKSYDCLGVVLQSNEKFEDAEMCYKKYQSLEPNKLSLIKSRGEILFNQGDFEQALRIFDSYDNITSRGCALESLYRLGRIESIYERIVAQADLYSENIRVAAIAAFLAEQQKKDTAHDFCNNPLDFINVSNIASHIEDSNLLITEVIDELHNVKTKWELNTTRNGFQSSIDVFKNPLEKMSILKSVIIDELNSYYSKFKDESCSYITKWPSEKIFYGWHVILKQQGHQLAHFHPTGWLSGVIYLKVVPTMGKQEGAIEFSLNGEKYYDAKLAKVLHLPKTGDIVMFPSSLHHRTIPFSSDTDRISIAFDLVPNLKKGL